MTGDQVFDEIWKTDTSEDGETVVVVLGSEDAGSELRLTADCADALTTALIVERAKAASIARGRPARSQAFLVDSVDVALGEDDTSILVVKLRSGATLRLAIEPSVARAAAGSLFALTAEHGSGPN